MNYKTFTSIIICSLSLGLTACAPNISPDTVSASEANDVQSAVEGIIVSKRVVTVKGDSNLLGTGVGAVAGGIAGSALGGGRGKLLTTLGGAVVGGAAGNLIEDKMQTQQGIEYVVKLTQEQGPTTTISTNGSASNSSGYDAKNRSTTTISSKSAANRYVNIIQGQGQQVLQVGQKVLVAGIGGQHARIISVLS